MKDHYKTLLIKFGATNTEIKKSYRRLAGIHHPDKNRGSKVSEEAFKQILTAYQVLSGDKRQSYDKDYLQYQTSQNHKPSGQGQKHSTPKATAYSKPNTNKKHRYNSLIEFSLPGFWAVVLLALIIYALTSKNDRHQHYESEGYKTEMPGTPIRDTLRSAEKQQINDSQQEIRPESGELKF